MTVAAPVHPFPARMAPELALERLPRRLDRRLRVLDPMMGSGTIPVIAALQGYRAIGFDCDPLAVLIARANGRSFSDTELVRAGTRVADRARTHSLTSYKHPDPETQDFIDYRFDKDAQRRLGALAAAIEKAPEEFSDPLWCAFSRLIITKDAGASRARDVSHSRPHRVRDRASFDAVERYERAVREIVERRRRMHPKRPADGRLRLGQADARKLPLAAESIDIVMTSPPYLQAIDYMRGHRMSLVWMGRTVEELRELRGNSIGSERGADTDPELVGAVPDGLSAPDPRGERILARYLSDLKETLSEVRRVLRSDGDATLVVADATLRGQPVAISRLVKQVAKVVGLECVKRTRRTIPTRNRYLPPPVADGPGTLDRRMRVEHCLTFRPAEQ